jgi:hypothetical protein
MENIPPIHHPLRTVGTISTMITVGQLRARNPDRTEKFEKSTIEPGFKGGNGA